MAFFLVDLILAYESVTDLLEQGFPVDVFLLDQAKAFDKLSHCYLMIKLLVYQIDNDVAQWIQSFLSNITQIFAVYDERGNLLYSTPVHIKSGVAHGFRGSYLTESRLSLYMMKEGISSIPHQFTLRVVSPKGPN